MDEYIGLPNSHPAGFGNFLRRAIFDKLPFKEIYYLQQEGMQPEEICAYYTGILQKYPPDLILLGVGENGHLAFNDPSVADFNDPKLVKIVQLDDVCRMQQVNDGCFAKIKEVPQTAITLTMSAIIQIPHTITVVPGRTKANAIDKIFHGPIAETCPASILRQHPDAKMFLDMDSASLALHHDKNA